MKTDTEFTGIPNDPPQGVEPLEDTDNLFTGGETEEDRELDDVLSAAGGVANRWRPVRRFFASGPLLLLLVCLILLFLFTQALGAVRQLQDLPALLRYPGFGLLGLLGCGIFWALVRLLAVFRRLKVTPRIPVATLRRLSERAELRRKANARLRESVVLLRGFLSTYPLEDRSETAKGPLRRLKPDELQRLRQTAQILMEAEPGTSEGWLERFDRDFLGPLDDAARRCIRGYAARVAIKTAALPAGFDTAVILLNAWLLAREMCLLYNLRTNGAGTAAILLRVMFNAFAASRMEEMTASAAEMFFEGSGAVAGMGRAVTARVAEGGVNSLLFMRLGAAMVRHLRPVWPPRPSR